MKSLGVGPAIGALLVNVANFLAVLPSIPMLQKFGRRSLMIVWCAVMCMTLVMMTASLEWLNLGSYTNLVSVGCLMLFVSAFEFSYGPILWLYLAEVCTDKGISMGILANWSANLLVGQMTPYILQACGNYTFLVYGGFCFVATLFVMVFMKETKGLTEV